MSLAPASNPVPSTDKTAPTPRELDPRLLAGAQKNDAGAQRALVLMYQTRVLTLCTRMLGDRARAEDAAQECFLKALSALGRFDPSGTARLSTWILTIAARTCLDELRRNRRVHVSLDALDPHGPLANELAIDDMAEPAALERALRKRVEKAVGELPEELRATFVLRVTGEMSVEETARALAVDEGTIKSRLSRARQRLREAIGEV